MQNHAYATVVTTQTNVYRTVASTKGPLVKGVGLPERRSGGIRAGSTNLPNPSTYKGATTGRAERLLPGEAENWHKSAFRNRFVTDVGCARQFDKFLFRLSVIPSSSAKRTWLPACHCEPVRTLVWQSVFLWCAPGI